MCKRFHLKYNGEKTFRSKGAFVEMKLGVQSVNTEKTVYMVIVLYT